MAICCASAGVKDCWATADLCSVTVVQPVSRVVVMARAIMIAPGMNVRLLVFIGLDSLSWKT